MIKSIIAVFVVSMILASLKGLGSGIYVSSGDIVLNGSFEALSIHGAPYNWTSPGTMGVYENWPNAPDGTNYLEIGTAWQTLSTTPGQAYTLSFYGAGDSYVSKTSTVHVGWGGQTAATFTTPPQEYIPGVNRGLQLVWQQFSTTVIANSSSTVLTFSTVNGTILDLDDVRVVPIPEPSEISFILCAVTALTFVSLNKRSPNKGAARNSRHAGQLTAP